MKATPGISKVVTTLDYILQKEKLSEVIGVVSMGVGGTIFLGGIVIYKHGKGR